MSRATTSILTHFWQSLPEPLTAKLCLGFTGKRHLLDIAGWCFGSGATDLLPIGVDAIQTALVENPLDGAMAGELLTHVDVCDALPGPTLDTLSALAESWRTPASTSYLTRLGPYDFGKLRPYIEQNITCEPDNLFWRELAVATSIRNNEPDWAAAMLEADFPTQPALAPLREAAMSHIDILRGQDATARFAGLSDTVFGAAQSMVRSGLCLIDEGNPAAANLLLADALRQTPWNTSLLLRLHDLLTAWDRERHLLTGSTAILIHSHDNAIGLDATLHALFATDLSGASLFILDNGSTDATAEVLASWKIRFEKRLGSGRFTTTSLPVDVGAPVARNWLMHLDAVQKHDFACFMDDTVEPPEDWLLRFGAAVHEYPEAGVWGCKIVDHTNRALVQDKAGHLIVDEKIPSPGLSRLEPNPFVLSTRHMESVDQGLLDTLRPCASVSGSCHLFRTKTLREIGDFALHLSPSGYHDTEYDLRLAQAGLFAVYQGHLTIQRRPASPTDGHNAMGNRYKMQTMHDRRDILQSTQKEQALMKEDLLHKMRMVDRAFDR